MTSPDVSILMPMRNAERFVEAALLSILAQGPSNFEILVIDDGSTDRSPAIVKKMGEASVRMIDGPKAGISACMNAGLTAARGPLIARCDADDLYPAGRLAFQLAWLKDHADFAGVCGAFDTITPAGKQAAQLKFSQRAEEVTQELLAGIARTHLCTYLIRASALKEIGGFRRWFTTAEDIDLQFRLAEVGRIHFDPTIAYHYRLHDQSITHQQAASQRAFFESCARSFLLDRQATGQDALARGLPPPVPPDDDAPRQSSSEHLQKILLGSAWGYHGKGEKCRALTTGLRACFHRPSNFSAWKSLLALGIRRAGTGK